MSLLKSSASSPAESSPWILFGLDLRTLGQDWWRAIERLHRLPPLRWFELNRRVRLMRASGSVCIWQQDAVTPIHDGGAGVEPAPFQAIEIPESMVLRRHLLLPELPDSQLRDAITLDVSSSSPFAADDVAWGYTQGPSANGVEVHAALASRAQIQRYVQSLPAALGAALERSEAWVMAPATAQPIVLQGFAEGLGEQASRARRIKTWLAMGILVLLLVALAVTPTLQLRNQALQANQAFHALTAQAARLNDDRVALTAALEDVAQIKEAMDRRVNPAEVLEMLSDTLPADVFVTDMEWNGKTIKLSAEATNATSIIQLLAAQEVFSEVRTTQAVQRARNTNRERFAVELTIAPGAFNVKYTDEPLPAPEEPPATEPLPAEAAAAAPAEPPAAQAPPPARRAPPASRPQAGQAAFGGGQAAFRGEAAGSSGVTPMAPPQRTPSALPSPVAPAGQEAEAAAAGTDDAELSELDEFDELDEFAHEAPLEEESLN